MIPKKFLELTNENSSTKEKIIAYLNCDEQYLPGTVAAVDSYFESHPDVDILFGHALITNPDGMLICFRKAYQPRKHFIMASHLYTLSCTMFFRRKIVDQGIAFDTDYQSIGDIYPFLPGQEII